MKPIVEYIQKKHVDKPYGDLLSALDNFIDNEFLSLGYTVNTGWNEGNKNEWIETSNHVALAKYFRNIDGWQDHFDHWADCFHEIAHHFLLSYNEGPSTVLDDVQVIRLDKGKEKVCALLIHPEHIAILDYEDIK